MEAETNDCKEKLQKTAVALKTLKSKAVEMQRKYSDYARSMNDRVHEQDRHNEILDAEVTRLRERLVQADKQIQEMYRSKIKLIRRASKEMDQLKRLAQTLGTKERLEAQEAWEDEESGNFVSDLGGFLKTLVGITAPRQAERAISEDSFDALSTVGSSMSGPPFNPQLLLDALKPLQGLSSTPLGIPEMPYPLHAPRGLSDASRLESPGWPRDNMRSYGSPANATMGIRTRHGSPYDDQRRPMSPDRGRRDMRPPQDYQQRPMRGQPRRQQGRPPPQQQVTRYQRPQYGQPVARRDMGPGASPQKNMSGRDQALYSAATQGFTVEETRRVRYLPNKPQGQGY